MHNQLFFKKENIYCILCGLHAYYSVHMCMYVFIKKTAFKLYKLKEMKPLICTEVEKRSIRTCTPYTIHTYSCNYPVSQ